jgi:uncharacterized protein YbjT (DUF2867 family)
MILIAGANGHVGKELVKNCIKRGFSTRCLDLHTLDIEQSDTLKVEIIKGDITNLNTAREAVKGVETVLSVMGVRKDTEEMTHEKLELEGTQHLIAASKESGVSHIMYISSMGVTKNVPVQRLKIKWDAEQMLIHSGIAYTIFRPSGYFTDFLEYFAPAIKEKGSFRVFGKGLTRLQPIAVEDVAETMVRAIGNEKAKNKIFPLAGPEIFTLREILTILGKVMGKEVKIQSVPFWVMTLFFTLIRSKSGKDFLYRAKGDSVCLPDVQREVREVFQIELKRMEPWLQAALPAEH